MCGAGACQFSVDTHLVEHTARESRIIRRSPNQRKKSFADISDVCMIVAEARWAVNGWTQMRGILGHVRSLKNRASRRARGQEREGERE